ncbi:MAG: hypothetical protein ACOZAA_12715 [Pseudomonadota bacterium]
MRVLLAALVVIVTSACSAPKTETPAPAESDSMTDDLADANGDAPPEGREKTIDDMRAESLAAIDRAACEGAGGEVRQEGMLGMWRCVKPYADAGKACRGKADCEGKCLATDDATPDDEIVGACQANDSPFGCYAEVEGGKIQSAICVD